MFLFVSVGLIGTTGPTYYLMTPMNDVSSLYLYGRYRTGAACTGIWYDFRDFLTNVPAS